jgi:hypothetical protein
MLVQTPTLTTNACSVKPKRTGCCLPQNGPPRWESAQTGIGALGTSARNLLEGDADLLSQFGLRQATIKTMNANLAADKVYLRDCRFGQPWFNTKPHNAGKCSITRTVMRRSSTTKC